MSSQATKITASAGWRHIQGLKGMWNSRTRCSAHKVQNKIPPPTSTEDSKYIQTSILVGGGKDGETPNHRAVTKSSHLVCRKVESPEEHRSSKLLPNNFVCMRHLEDPLRLGSNLKSTHLSVQPVEHAYTQPAMSKVKGKWTRSS